MQLYYKSAFILLFWLVYADVPTRSKEVTPLLAPPLQIVSALLSMAIWLYVCVTGVIVYLMLYQIYPS